MCGMYLQTDRFITDRSAMDFDMANYLLSEENAETTVISPSKVRLYSIPRISVKVGDYVHRDIVVSWMCIAHLHFLIWQEEYKKQLAEDLLNDNGQKQSRILAFKSKPPPPPEGFENGRKTLYSQNLNAGQQLASGGNDNLLHIWDSASTSSGSNSPVSGVRLSLISLASRTRASSRYSKT